MRVRGAGGGKSTVLKDVSAQGLGIWGAGGRLTIIVDEEGSVGREDLIVADLAVLWGAVAINGFHPQDAIVELPLSHCGTVQPLHKHRGKLVHIVDPHVHRRPAQTRAGEDTRSISQPLTWEEASRSLQGVGAGGSRPTPELAHPQHRTPAVPESCQRAGNMRRGPRTGQPM